VLGVVGNQGRHHRDPSRQGSHPAEPLEQPVCRPGRHRQPDQPGQAEQDDEPARLHTRDQGLTSTTCCKFEVVVTIWARLTNSALREAHANTLMRSLSFFKTVEPGPGNTGTSGGPRKQEQLEGAKMRLTWGQ
jgi:hypothetical protein